MLLIVRLVAPTVLLVVVLSVRLFLFQNYKSLCSFAAKLQKCWVGDGIGAGWEVLVGGGGEQGGGGEGGEGLRQAITGAQDSEFLLRPHAHPMHLTARSACCPRLHVHAL